MGSRIHQDQKDLMYLFEKPYDPLYIPRGEGGRLAYGVPGAPPSVATRFGGGAAEVIPTQPDARIGTRLRNQQGVERGGCFSPFLSNHRTAAKELTDLFMQAKTAQELKNMAIGVRDQVNETLFIFALSFVILRKREFRHIRIPSIIETFPYRFIPMETVRDAGSSAEPVEHDLDFTGTDLNPEHRVAYWREDYGINAHHWHWHLVYPLNMSVNRDRKGELFYYMHQQMIARYDMERLSVGLTRLRPLSDFRASVGAGYFSKLTVNNSGRAWGTRQDESQMKDFNRRDFFTFEPFTISDLEAARDRIIAAIGQRAVTDVNGRRVALDDDVEVSPTNKRGIDILGDLIEADTELSPNSRFYGDIHNEGHVLLAFMHDPDGSHKEEPAVIADTGTAMRDPVFYRWHKFIDDLFSEYKINLPPYPETEFSLPGIRLQRFAVATGREANVLYTGWNRREIEVSRGLDFAQSQSVRVRLTHLNHRPFDYHFQVANNTGRQKAATVRIFMAPKVNEHRADMNYMDQRSTWAEMDKFAYNLNPGNNYIMRSSNESSITIPSELTFRDLENAGQDMPQEDYCGCGWPQHMLLPRGRPEGMTFEVFVMLTDWDADRVNESSRRGSRDCRAAASFCGVLDALYPDKKPMGFPFDRRNPAQIAGRSINRAADLAVLDNIMVTEVTIRFLNNEL